MTPRLLRKAIRRWLLRKVGWYVPALLVGMLLLAAFLAWHGMGEWTVFAATVTVLIALVLLVYVFAVRRSVRKFQKLASDGVIHEISDEGISTRTAAGTGRVDWRVFEALWCFPDVWLLIMAGGNYLVFPAAELDEGARALMVAKVRENGGEVR